MNSLLIWVALAVAVPIGARVLQRRVWPGSTGPFHPIALLMFCSCLLVWLLMAWKWTGGPVLRPRYFWATCFFGVIWIESILLLMPRNAFRRAETPSADSPPVPAGHEELSSENEDSAAVLSEEAEGLWQRISLFDSVEVHSIMTPKEQVQTIGIDRSAAEALREMRASGRTRLVAIDGSLERVVGIAHAKDLAPLLPGGREDEPVRRHHRRLRRVPARQSLSALVELFRRERTSVGLVIDLRGKTLGLVTLGDVFRYVSGGEDTLP